MEFQKVNPIENGSDADGEKKDKLVPRVPNKGSFTSENQPSDEAKSRGWWKKKRGKHLMQALLNLDFVGDQLDEEAKQRQENIVKRQAAAYFNIPEIFITNEMIMNMRQIGKAIQSGDTQAFNSVMDRAYGKPKEHIEVEEVKSPQIVLNYGRIGMQDENGAEIKAEADDAVPPIATSENEIKIEGE